MAVNLTDVARLLERKFPGGEGMVNAQKTMVGLKIGPNMDCVEPVVQRIFDATEMTAGIQRLADNQGLAGNNVVVLRADEITPESLQKLLDMAPMRVPEPYREVRSGYSSTGLGLSPATSM